jgi:sugar lactone lactonase YvrE
VTNGFWGGVAAPSDWEAADAAIPGLEVVHEFTDGPMPTGVTVSASGRIFVNFPKWGDEVPATVAELRDGRVVPYPDERWNSPEGDDDEHALVSVQSVVVDPADRLWILDTGSPLFQETKPGGPKLVCVDLTNDDVVQIITFPPDVALPTTYLNDVRFDLRKGKAGVAFITDSADSGPNGIIVVDLASGDSWRRLHDHPSTKAAAPPEFVARAEGRVLLERDPDGGTKPISMGADGIAISADGERLWYCPLMSRRWYSVATTALLDRDAEEVDVAHRVQDEGDKGGGADGLESDDAGRIYATDWEHDAIVRRLPDGTIETIAHDPRMLWPDTMSVAADGHLYFTANQLHRQAQYQGGEDLRRYPYRLFRLPIDAGPVRLA